MKVFILICMWKGIINEVYAFREENKAIKEFETFTGEKWSKVTKAWDEFQEGHYNGTGIHELGVI